ncbi:adaptor-related protein complex 3, sigma 2 subunit isoform X2 [Gallus gallus]|uniref:adaptor-related protein complex 3, sigma 2 subunit isoform X2 n=1 Tax=Gallus gallus TaxID=9031 RepID=UPI001F0182FF|nr:adaptor-related protein complex 3, sigma 2 subunit isoform X2 [Gallus gallus]
MINAILVFNNHGKPRLVRFYRHLVRGGGLRAGGPGGAGGVRGRGRSVPAGGGGAAADPPRHLPYGAAARRARLQLPGVRLFGSPDCKLIYRHYATLYFVFCVDSSESELGILDLIQVFVETLDKCFENVCELDLIFHMDKVHYILQEVVIGGMVLETNMNEIVAQAEAQSKLEKAEVSGSVWGLERGAQVWAQGRLGSGYHAGASVLWGGGRRELVALRVSQPAHPQGKAHRVGAPHWGVQGAASMQVLLCCQG